MRFLLEVYTLSLWQKCSLNSEILVAAKTESTDQSEQNRLTPCAGIMGKIFGEE